MYNYLCRQQNLRPFFLQLYFLIFTGKGCRDPLTPPPIPRLNARMKGPTGFIKCIYVRLSESKISCHMEPIVTTEVNIKVICHKCNNLSIFFFGVMQQKLAHRDVCRIFSCKLLIERDIALSIKLSKYIARIICKIHFYTSIYSVMFLIFFKYSN